MKPKESDDGKAAEDNLNPTTTGGETSVAVKENVAEATHEINNFLTGILGQAQLLRREDLNPAAQRRVEVIEQLAKRIKDTLRRLTG